MRRVLRYEVPIDNEWHFVEMNGGVLQHADQRELKGPIELWAMPPYAEGAYVAENLEWRIYGTGEEVPDEAIFMQSVLSPSHQLADLDVIPRGREVWHLFCREIEE